MAKTLRALSAVLILGLLAAACSDDAAPGEDDLRAELDRLNRQIEEAGQAAGQRGVVGEMAAQRREVLKLSAAMLESRLIAGEAGVPEKLVAPAQLPDTARAAQLERHIDAAEEALEAAKEAAGGREGIAGNLSQTAVATQELTLAQLRLAYVQAAYGLALPGAEAAPATAAPAPAPQPAPQPASESESESGPAPVGPAAQAAPESTARAAPASAPSGQQQAALPPLREVSVPQLPPSSYTRRDYTQIQVLLEDAGFDPGPIDGHWGPRTQRALAAFQRDHGLRASGQPDAATLDALGFY
jgi:hypothetical protein